MGACTSSPAKSDADSKKPRTFGLRNHRLPDQTRGEKERSVNLGLELERRENGPAVGNKNRAEGANAPGSLLVSKRRDHEGWRAERKHDEISLKRERKIDIDRTSNCKRTQPGGDRIFATRTERTHVRAPDGRFELATGELFSTRWRNIEAQLKGRVWARAVWDRGEARLRSWMWKGVIAATK